jgi:hypothetical protein
MAGRRAMSMHNLKNTRNKSGVGWNGSQALTTISFTDENNEKERMICDTGNSLKKTP